MSNKLEQEKHLAASEAVKHLKNGQIVGLGTGSTAEFAIREIGALVKNGLDIKCVSTSAQTSKLAIDLGLHLIDINSVDQIDITIDGADEFTDDLILIKGGGGALFREKIVASMTRTQIVIADSSKRVERLGHRGVPIEVVPFALSYVEKQIRQHNGVPILRMADDQPFLTEQKNYILDAKFGVIDDPIKLSGDLNAVDGILSHGIFIGLADIVIWADGDEIKTITRK